MRAGRWMLRGRSSALVCVVVTSIGCTMCPDPFDYSGPVPNGSPPQNDFRARSNGILPLGAAPRPWPTLVESEGDAAPDGESGTRSILVADRRAGDPAADGDIEPATIPEADPAAVEAPGDLGEPADDAAAEFRVDAADEVAGNDGGAEIAPDPEDLGPLSQTEGALVIPPDASQALPATGAVFQARETPGWRSRR